MKHWLIMFAAAVGISLSCLAYASSPEPRIEVTLQVNEDSSGTLQIHNHSQNTLELQPLSQRFSVAFLVTGRNGNIMPPNGRGKVDPPVSETFTLAAGEVFRHSFSNFDFLTGTALFGYDLEKSHTYRVVAVYRPQGLEGPGFCSKEVTFTYQ